MSDTGISVRIGRQKANKSWESIKAVNFSGRGASRVLVIYCEEDFIRIPCRFYDEIGLMEDLKEYLPASVLHPFAYQGLPRFIEWQQNVAEKLSAVNRPLKVSLGGFERWTGIFSTSIGLIFVCLYFFSAVDTFTAVIMGGLFGGLGILLLFLCNGWVEGDSNIISVKTLFRKNTFNWNDLREIYINSNLGVMALVSDNSRLILPRVTSFSGKDKELLYELIDYKIQMSRIEPVESHKPLFWSSKNA